MPVGKLLDNLASADRETREAAINAATTDALGALMEALCDENSPIDWSNTARAVQRLGDPAFDVVLAALREPVSDDVKRRLRWTFGSIRVSDLVATYGRVLGDADASLRSAAVQVFQSQGEAAHGPLLVPLLHDPDEYVRRRAVWAFADIGPEILPLLREVRRGTGPARRGALTALAETAGWDALDATDRDLVRRLIRTKLPKERLTPLERPDTGWFALPTGDQAAVLEEFGLSGAEPVTHRLGLSAADGYIRYGQPHGRCAWLYVTAELDGWTLVFGTPPELSYRHFEHLPEDETGLAVSTATRTMTARLSARFGRACWYRSSTGDSQVAWCLAEGGEVVRLYDTALMDHPDPFGDPEPGAGIAGPPHPAEAGFRLPHVRTDYPDGWFDGYDFADPSQTEAVKARFEQYKREQGLDPYCGPTDIAERTSVSPAKLGPDTQVRGHGVLALTECGRAHGTPRGTREI